MLTNAPSGSSSCWFPDSGASYHVTGNSQNIQQLTPFEEPEQIYTGKGQGLPIRVLYWFISTLFSIQFQNSSDFRAFIACSINYKKIS